MMRACHLNTCPVGIATQDPELRQRFTGQPEHVVNFFFFVAEEARRLMARLGVARFEDLVGRVDLLDADEAVVRVARARRSTSRRSCTGRTLPAGRPLRRTEAQPPALEDALDWRLIEAARHAIDGGVPTEAEFAIANTNRTVGGLLSHAVTREHGAAGLPEGTIRFTLRGSAGQSFGAWLAHGIELTLVGDANDYVGKGLSGGVLALRPPDDAGFVAEENVIAGNTVLYGATGGRAFFRGLAGERFAVRNSGACAVVEGVGDHGCEYMTGGIVGRARADRPELRRRHERRRRLRPRRGRRRSRTAATTSSSGSSRSARRTRRPCARSSPSTSGAPARRWRRACSPTGTRRCSGS